MDLLCECMSLTVLSHWLTVSDWLAESLSESQSVRHRVRARCRHWQTHDSFPLIQTANCRQVCCQLMRLEMDWLSQNFAQSQTRTPLKHVQTDLLNFSPFNFEQSFILDWSSTFAQYQRGWEDQLLKKFWAKSLKKKFILKLWMDWAIEKYNSKIWGLLLKTFEQRENHWPNEWSLCVWVRHFDCLLIHFSFIWTSSCHRLSCCLNECDWWWTHSPVQSDDLSQSLTRQWQWQSRQSTFHSSIVWVSPEYY